MPRRKAARRPAPDVGLAEQRERQQETVRLINEALAHQDLQQLRKLACVRGLVSNGLRERCWRALSGAGAVPHAAPAEYEAWAAVEHRDRHVVRADVERSLFTLMPTASEQELEAKRQQLSRLLNAVVGRHCGASGVPLCTTPGEPSPDSAQSVPAKRLASGEGGRMSRRSSMAMRASGSVEAPVTMATRTASVPRLCLAVGLSCLSQPPATLSPTCSAEDLQGGAPSTPGSPICPATATTACTATATAATSLPASVLSRAGGGSGESTTQVPHCPPLDVADGEAGGGRADWAARPDPCGLIPVTDTPTEPVAVEDRRGPTPGTPAASPTKARRRVIPAPQPSSGHAGAQLPVEGGEAAGTATLPHSADSPQSRPTNGCGTTAARVDAASCPPDGDGPEMTVLAPVPPRPPLPPPPPPIVPTHQTVFYYQGLHDVATVLLLVCGSEAAAFPLLTRLVGLQLRDATRASLAPIMEVLGMLYPLLEAVDPAMARHLQAEDLPPFFALSWLITWFAHDVRDLEVAARLFDVFMASHPLMPLYVGVAAMQGARAQILDCTEMPELHRLLVNLSITEYPGDGAAGALDGHGRAGQPPLSRATSLSTRDSAGSGGAVPLPGSPTAQHAAAARAQQAAAGALAAVDALIAAALKLYRASPPAALVKRHKVKLVCSVLPAASLDGDIWAVPEAPPYAHMAGTVNRVVGHSWAMRNSHNLGGNPLTRLARAVRQFGSRGRIEPVTPRRGTSFFGAAMGRAAAQAAASSANPHRMRTALQIGGVLGVYLVAALISYATTWGHDRHNQGGAPAGIIAD